MKHLYDQVLDSRYLNPNLFNSLYSIERYFNMFTEFQLYELAAKLEVKSNYNRVMLPIITRVDIIWRIAFECWNFNMEINI